jgi:N-methylhydantoinase A
MHAVRLAAMFGITSVAVPLAAGVASAVGLVGADLHVDVVQTRVIDLGDADPLELEAAYRELTDQARAELADEPGTAFEVTRSADVRYRGQAYHLTLPVPDPPLTADDVAALAANFRQRFEDTYRIALDLPTQIHNLRVHIVRVVDKFAPRARKLTLDGPSAARVGEREVLFAGAGTDTGTVVTTLYDRTRLVPGDQFEGPAVIAAPESTIVVPPHTRAEVDAYGTVLLSLYDPFSAASPGIVAPDS